jgi:hypothetical protein
MKLAIFPTGTIDETYYFVMKNNLLICSVGTRYNDSINTKKFMKSINESKEIKLSDQNYKEILKLLNNIKDTSLNNEKQQILDSWHVLLLYDGKIYEEDYWQNESDAFKKIIEKIISLSPITIDLHGWS